MSKFWTPLTFRCLDLEVCFHPNLFCLFCVSDVAMWFGLKKFQSFYCTSNVVTDVLLASISVNVFFWLLSIVMRLVRECERLADGNDGKR